MKVIGHDHPGKPFVGTVALQLSQDAEKAPVGLERVGAPAPEW